MAYNNLPTTLPSGAKLWLLNLGYLDCELTGLISGANTFLPGEPPRPHDRRELIMISALVYHPDVGLILFDVGSSEDQIRGWHPEVVECTPRTWEKGVHDLPSAIEATGAGTIKDVKAVVLSHLHYDHAGGLENFLDTDVEIWVHEKELKNAFWYCATGIDDKNYVPSYLIADRLRWKTYRRDAFNIWPGITLYHVPGHTVGCVVMELTLEKSGVVVLTGDLFHVKENYEDGIPQAGAMIRDYAAWCRSRDFVTHLVRSKRAKVILGHEKSYFETLAKSPAYTE